VADSRGAGTIINDDPWTWYVAGTGSDTNDCVALATPCRSISEAAARAFPGDTIQVLAGTYPENVVLNQDTTLIGQGAASVIDGGGVAVVVTVSAGATVTMSGFDIRNGGDGGIAALGDLTLIDSWVHGNGGSSSAAALRVEATARIERCTFSDNRGAVASAVDNGGQLELINSTVTGNLTSAGAALANQGDLSMVGCTVADNAGVGLAGPGSYTLTSTIVAGQPGGNCEHSVITLGGNLEDGDSCGLQPALDDLFGVDPQLLDLTMSGGWTPTRRLDATSPALDSAPAAGCPEADQRGFARPADGDGDGVAVCDRGAVETQADEVAFFSDGFESGGTAAWDVVAP
jgi:hypothetical protein